MRCSPYCVSITPVSVSVIGGETHLKTRSRKAFLILLMFIMLIILLISGIVTKGLPNTSDELEYLRDWSAEDVSGKTDSDYFASDKQTYVLEMSHDLTQDMCGRFISFRTNDSYVDAYLITEDDRTRTQLYHFGDDLRFSDSPGTYTHFIEMPENGSGRVMIRIETAYKNKFLKTYDVAIGAKNELIYGYLRSETMSVIPNILLFIFGLFLLIIYFVSCGLHSPVPEALSLSALTMTFTIYANCPLFTNQYIFHNAVTQYYLNYFSLYLLPLLAMIYFEDIVPELNMKWLFYGYFILEAALTVIHFTGIASYTRSIKIFTASLGVFAVVSVVMLTRKFRKLALLNKIALITLLFFLSLNVLFFIFVSTIGNQPYLSKIGMLLYIGIAIVNGLQKLMKGFFKERESELLHKIAYTDNLTKLGNRYALERDTKQLPLESISIISLDLNYLKYTNDTFGHFGGDVLLKAAAECISSVYDKVYRVGGDEFIALLNDTDTQTLDSLSEKLRENVAVFNRERTSFKEFADSENFVLSIAAGYATYQAQDITYEQIMNRADEQMYQTKKEFHAKYGTIPETAVPRRQ